MYHTLHRIICTASIDHLYAMNILPMYNTLLPIRKLYTSWWVVCFDIALYDYRICNSRIYFSVEIISQTAASSISTCRYYGVFIRNFSSVFRHVTIYYSLRISYIFYCLYLYENIAITSVTIKIDSTFLLIYFYTGWLLKNRIFFKYNHFCS